MGRCDMEHPEIGWIERTGYPSWMQEEEEEEDLPEEDECEFMDDGSADRYYDEARDRELFGDLFY